MGIIDISCYVNGNSGHFIELLSYLILSFIKKVILHFYKDKSKKLKIKYVRIDESTKRYNIVSSRSENDLFRLLVFSSKMFAIYRN